MSEKTVTVDKDLDIYTINLKTPTDEIMLTTGRVVVGKKAWVDDGSNRYLLGSSAFFTEAAARRARDGAIRELVARDWDGQAESDTFKKAVKYLARK